MPKLFWKAWSWFLSVAQALEGWRGCPRFLLVDHLHDNEPFVPGSSLLPRLIT